MSAHAFRSPTASWCADVRLSDNRIYTLGEFACCRYMYVADLVALPAQRGKGYGKALFAYLEDAARQAGCKRSAALFEYKYVLALDTVAHILFLENSDTVNPP